MRFDAAHHALAPPVLNDALGFLGARAVVTVKRSGRKVYVKLRPVIRDLSLKSVEDSLGRPPGLAGVFSISGGTELISTAFATRLSPWRPI